ncbi:putative late blight resistance protein homolog R1A-10 [Salvia miltiorrhiza]|uniref:putative late blight resistance protein homolog R1A-10 n=1 Tax=Salvia miltiorrhiza TaxID=226208 RepID=UPI0025AD5DBF|nr:putative late blight resistance protein homolog R1A-10 [Salvia miltiorrhiza]
MSTQQNLDATISDAASKAKKALTEFLHPQKYTLEFFRSMNISLLDFLLDLFPYALFVVLIRLVVLYLQTSSQKMKYILGHLCLIFASNVATVVVVLVVLTAQYNSGAPKKQDLPHAIDDFGMVVTDLMKIKEAYGNTSDLPPPAASSREDLGDTGKDVLVGLDSAVDKIRERLLEASSERQLLSIVGMGGIGKTTLAIQVFKDGAILAHFDVRAWVTVSQEYSLRHFILCLLDSAQMLTQEKRQDINEQVLGMYLHQHLMYRRYLIIIDDVWDTQICCLDPSSRVYQMPCLNDKTSWKLLCTKVCPTELESIGREIAKSCKGLPLAVVVIGGLLCKDIQIKVWRDVAETFKNQQSLDFNEQCLRILGLSYNHLPHHLRPCLLYIVVFLGDCEIPISRLINLWVAEGFLELHASKTLEDVAEGYLKDLIARNLVSICKKSCNGKIRTCNIHDLLRDVCVQNAHNENFLRVVDSTGERPDESPRRISIHLDALQANSTHDLMKSYSYVRSIVCMAGKPIDNPLVAYLSFVYLRVLDVLDVCFRKFPHQIIRLVRLRYLALYYDGPLPASISKLHNLETLVHHHSSFHSYPLLSWVIWNMPKLRHLYVKPGCYFINPYRLSSSVSFLLDLQTLVGVRNFKWTKGIIERIPNLKKLGISYRVSSSVDWSTYQLETLVYLRRLESLKIIIKCD